MKKSLKFTILVGVVVVYAVFDITCKISSYLINTYIKAEGKWL